MADLPENLGELALLTDIDGTLAPIVQKPGDAAVGERAQDALRTLAGECRLVACVSGRRALEARRLVGVDEITYVGNHGFELLQPGAERPRLNSAVAGHERRAAQFLAKIDADELVGLGIRTEDKGPIQALHWRGAPDERAAEAWARGIAMQAQSSGLVSRWGRKVLEVRPVTGIDKGSAVHWLIRDSEASVALYAGDDRTDLDAFRALSWLAGTGRVERVIRVGVASDDGPPEIVNQADIVVEGVDGVVDLLVGLAGG